MDFRDLKKRHNIMATGPCIPCISSTLIVKEWLLKALETAFGPLIRRYNNEDEECLIFVWN